MLIEVRKTETTKRRKNIMADFNESEFLKYLNSNDYAKQHKHASTDDEDRSIAQMLADSAKLALQDKLESIELEWGVWKPDQKLKTEAKRRDAIMAHDETRPQIKDLKFQPLPKERADGLKGGFLAMAWNAFVAEIAAGNVEYAPVLVLDYQDVSFDDSRPIYYFKVMDPDGNVCRGGVRKIKFNTLGMVDHNHTSPKHDDYVAYFRWDWPEDYVESHPNRPEEDYKLYEMTFMANGLADKLSTEHRKPAYIIHYKKKGTDLYGLVTQSEFDDLKSLKDDITFMKPENCFQTENNIKLDFTW